ncbi:hypothetical protein RA28_00175 [Ruegeria sp. ANG-S4]|uniref:hypothetical protein n=1 Tax=Ruegeria sp. ANG-S4 TaxID=1577904 RepID=UPI0005800D45|nr:hypothetical protein [Ruegeria sp. ANG-S4]KIC46276.1 hypothetical protein RA28_00175 [Ruegeria sp. ANG-S4]
MKWFSQKDVRLLRVGLVLVVWPIPIFGLLAVLNELSAEGGAYKLLGFIALYVGPGSVVFGLITFALYLISEVFLLPWRISHCRGTGYRNSQND